MADVPTVAVPEGLVVRAVDVGAAPESELALLYEVEVALEAETHPGDVPAPIEDFVIGCRTHPSFEAIWTWVVVEEASQRPVATLECSFERVPENTHLLWVEMGVIPDWRGRGVARHLLSLAARVAADEGRSLLMGPTVDAAPSGPAFAERLGADPGLVQRESELDLTTLDREMVARWVDDGPQRAPDYELVLYEGPLPESEYERYATLQDSTNDAPRDGLDFEDEHMTAEQLAEREQRLAAGREERWTLLARRKGEDAYAGFTEVFWSPWNPRLVFQGWTAVHADHRGHALGKWLKGAMLAKIFAERREAEVVRTDNAYSNDAMLGINIALGFGVTRTLTEWQLKLDQILEYLSG